LGQENLTITTLTNLGQDLEVAMPKSYSTLAKVGALSSGVFSPHLIVRLLIGLWGWRIFILEGC
jgi:hypothetical protein